MPLAILKLTGMKRHYTKFVTLLSTLLITALPVSALACVGNVLDEGETVVSRFGTDIENMLPFYVIGVIILYLFSLLAIKRLKYAILLVVAMIIINIIGSRFQFISLLRVVGVFASFIACAKLSVYITKKTIKPEIENIEKALPGRLGITLAIMCTLEVIVWSFYAHSRDVINEFGFDTYIERFF